MKFKEYLMIICRHRVKFNFLLALFIITGFTIVFSSTAFSISNPIKLMKAGFADAEGDKAYYEGKNFKRAFAEYKKAAEGGNAHGQFMLANMYLAGEAVKKDRKKYMYWMNESGKKGYAPANYLLGMAYLYANPSDSVEYFKKAVKKEHGSSMHMLGVMYAKGVGVEKSSKEALRWFRLAKAQGVPIRDQWLSQSGIEQSFTKRQAVSYVKEIQKRLIKKGYNPGTADGIYGKKTRIAIKAFQKKMGMRQDGLATDKVLMALKDSSH
jgi:TPR repeat protein